MPPDRSKKTPPRGKPIAENENHNDGREPEKEVYENQPEKDHESLPLSQWWKQPFAEYVKG